MWKHLVYCVDILATVINRIRYRQNIWSTVQFNGYHRNKIHWDKSSDPYSRLTCCRGRCYWTDRSHDILPKSAIPPKHQRDFSVTMKWPILHSVKCSRGSPSNYQATIALKLDTNVPPSRFNTNITLLCGANTCHAFETQADMQK